MTVSGMGSRDCHIRGYLPDQLDGVGSVLASGKNALTRAILFRSLKLPISGCMLILQLKAFISEQGEILP